MHLILDLDGTLIKYGADEARPYLGMFLEYCFRRFHTVSIWTAAEEFWYERVLEKTLQPILNAVSDRLKRKCQFYLIMTRKHCVWEGKLSTKPLEMLWDHFDHMDEKNTVIVDDNPHNFGFNYDNGIYIPQYKGGDDNYLEKLVGFFDTFSNADSIQKVNKFLWFK